VKEFLKYNWLKKLHIYQKHRITVDCSMALSIPQVPVNSDAGTVAAMAPPMFGRSLFPISTRRVPSWLKWLLVIILMGKVNIFYGNKMT